MKAEVKSNIRLFKNGKALGLDELLQVLVELSGEFLIGELASLFHDILEQVAHPIFV